MIRARRPMAFRKTIGARGPLEPFLLGQTRPRAAGVSLQSRVYRSTAYHIRPASAGRRRYGEGAASRAVGSSAVPRRPRTWLLHLSRRRAAGGSAARARGAATSRSRSSALWSVASMGAPLCCPGGPGGARALRLEPPLRESQSKSVPPARAPSRRAEAVPDA